jgi:rubrerythrin
MVRGRILFICRECEHKFMAADIEYLCTSLSTPQRCPQCQSIRTRPVSLFGKIVNKKYEPIWKQMENNQ